MVSKAFGWTIKLLYDKSRSVNNMSVIYEIQSIIESHYGQKEIIEEVLTWHV